MVGWSIVKGKDDLEGEKSMTFKGKNNLEKEKLYDVQGARQTWADVAYTMWADTDYAENNLWGKKQGLV